MNRHAFCISIYNKVFKFRKWFKYGLMAQKFQKQHALNQRSPAEGKGKGQKLLAQGNTLGINNISPCRPVRAKALNIIIEHCKIKKRYDRNYRQDLLRRC